MNDEITVVMEGDSVSYLESLIRSRKKVEDNPGMYAKLEAVIMVELDLALLGAEKAKSEHIKSSGSNIKPIK